MEKQKRILIVRQDRIGDVVLSTPIPLAIKKQWTDSFVAVLVKNYTKDIYLNNPYVDKILCFEELDYSDFKSFVKAIKKIRQYKFTHALMLLPSEKINYLLFFSGIKNRIGVGYKFYQFITFVKGISRKKYKPLRHEADYSMDLARNLGVKQNELVPEIYLNNDEKEKVKIIKKDLLLNKKFLVGIHITSGNSAPNLSEEDYLKLITELSKFKNYKIVITDNVVPKIIQNIENVDYPNANLSLRESILNFAALDCLISASTGPMHIASALKVNTVSIFCPLEACSPKLWGPLGNNHKIILPRENYCNTVCPGNPKICSYKGESEAIIKEIVISVQNILENKNNYAE